MMTPPEVRGQQVHVVQDLGSRRADAVPTDGPEWQQQAPAWPQTAAGGASPGRRVRRQRRHQSRGQRLRVRRRAAGTDRHRGWLATARRSRSVERRRPLETGRAHRPAAAASRAPGTARRPARGRLAGHSVGRRQRQRRRQRHQPQRRRWRQWRRGDGRPGRRAGRDRRRDGDRPRVQRGRSLRRHRADVALAARAPQTAPGRRRAGDRARRSDPRRDRRRRRGQGDGRRGLRHPHARPPAARSPLGAGVQARCRIR